MDQQHLQIIALMLYRQVTNKQEWRVSDSRLSCIPQSALKVLKIKNQGFLKKFERAEFWDKLTSGLIANGKEISLKKDINFKICPSQTPDKSLFNPFIQKPIVMCYNKINKKQIFDKILTYNLVLLYDTRTKGFEQQNWNNLQNTAYTTIRALTISELCEKKDQKCFKEEIQKRVLSKQRFAGCSFKDEQFRKLLEEAVSDNTPISQIRYFQREQEGSKL